MSVFRKITLLFSLSLLLMIAIGYQVDTMNAQRTEALVTQKYLQDARKLFTLLATTETDALEKRLAPMGFARVGAAQTAGAETLLEQPHSFGDLKILKTRDGRYLLAISYMDTSLLLSDTALQHSLRGQWLPNALVGLDIAVLVAIFFIILAMLSPLKQIAAKMRAFAAGDYDSRTDVPNRDEIGAVAATYNDMAQRLQDLIASRETLLRDIGHELRTPIARGMFAAEKLPASDDKRLLQRCFAELERLTDELLQLEKLGATGALHYETVDAETLILQALSKTMVDDEAKVAIEIGENFQISGDPDYLSLALKNLIDNALKYTSEYPVVITASARTICVSNRGEPLGSALAQYLQPFRRGAQTQQHKGFGLGLSIVAKVLERHAFALTYGYENGIHRFCIDCQTPA
jgi:two-component system, OmpR family, sensor kinase